MKTPTISTTVYCHRCEGTETFDPIKRFLTYERDRYRAPGENLRDFRSLSAAAIGSMRPPGWGAVELSLAGMGELEPKRVVSFDLCPGCWEHVKNATNPVEAPNV
jgi:hypothetical protein